MSQLQTLIEDTLWTVPHPLSFLGMKVGTRMTVLKLPSGGLLLHSPIPLSGALKAEIDALGPVTQIIAPNRYHHLYAGPAKEAYPEALLHAAPGLQKKRKDLAIDAELSERAHADFEGVLEPLPIASKLGEVAFFHEPSATILSADLVENFSEGSPHLPTRLYLKSGGIFKKPGIHPLLKMMFRDRKTARSDIDRILELPFERVVVAHGEIVTENARSIVEATYTFL